MPMHEDEWLEIHEQIMPEGWKEISSYTPHYSICSWDYYGGLSQMEWINLMAEHCIKAIPLMVHRRRKSASGTGPGGLVRFGDDMVPSVYRVAVHEKHYDQAMKIISDYNESGAGEPEGCEPG